MSERKISYQSSRLHKIIAGVCALLTIPITAERFSSEVQWSLGDFVAGGVLLFLLGFCIDFVLYNKQINKAWLILAILTFAFIWAELAVGIFF